MAINSLPNPRQSSTLRVPESTDLALSRIAQVFVSIDSFRILAKCLLFARFGLWIAAQVTLGKLRI
jgi:hypothetical protein